jgi:hypothetical protein
MSPFVRRRDIIRKWRDFIGWEFKYLVQGEKQQEDKPDTYWKLHIFSLFYIYVEKKWGFTSTSNYINKDEHL